MDFETESKLQSQHRRIYIYVGSITCCVMPSSVMLSKRMSSIVPPRLRMDCTVIIIICKWEPKRLPFLSCSYVCPEPVLVKHCDSSRLTILI